MCGGEITEQGPGPAEPADIAAPTATSTATTPDGLPSCATPNEGCPCASEGQELECGKVVRRTGDYVSCSMGQRKCTGGLWGSCQGDQLAATNVPPQPQYKPLGLGASQLCVANPCDPYCHSYTDNTAGLDAGGPRRGSSSTAAC